MHHTRLSTIYRLHRIPGHPVQMHATAMLVQYLSGRYPHAWQRNGRSMLLLHVRNLDVKGGIDHDTDR